MLGSVGVTDRREYHHIMNISIGFLSFAANEFIRELISKKSICLTNFPVISVKELRDSRASKNHFEDSTQKNSKNAIAIDLIV